MRAEALAVAVRRGRLGCVRESAPRRHTDAVDRAGRQALGAADADFLIDLRDQRRALDPVGGIQRERRAPEKRGERGDSGRAAWRALVDLGPARQDRLRVRATAVVAAARALRLWQQGIDVVGGDHGLMGCAEKAPWGAAPSADPHSRSRAGDVLGVEDLRDPQVYPLELVDGDGGGTGGNATWTGLRRCRGSVSGDGLRIALEERVELLRVHASDQGLENTEFMPRRQKTLN